MSLWTECCRSINHYVVLALLPLYAFSLRPFYGILVEAPVYVHLYVLSLILPLSAVSITLPLSACI